MTPGDEVGPKYKSMNGGKTGLAKPSASLGVGEVSKDGKFLDVERLVHFALFREPGKFEFCELLILGLGMRF